MEKIIYLDNAATSFPKPDSVHDAMRDFYKNFGVNPGRSGCDLAITAEEMIHNTRIRLSNLFNESLIRVNTPKDPNRLIFTLNATMALNLVIQGTVKAPEHVVSTVLEHNSVLRPLNHLAQQGVEFTLVSPNPEGYLDPENIRKAIRKNTRLVIINHASNVIGVVQDMKAIGTICREYDIAFAVDSAQTAGLLPIDMAECNISFLIFTGHKCLLAPTGTGGVCVADHAQIRPVLYGGTGVKSSEPLQLEEFPFRLEAGTQNLAGIAGLHAGLNWLSEQGQENIYKHEMALFSILQDGLSQIQGVTLHGTKSLENRVATLSITVINYDPSDVGTFLDVDYGIQTRTGLQCAPLIHRHLGTFPRGTVRFSLGPMNTREEINASLEAISQIAIQAKKRTHPKISSERNQLHGSI